MSLSSSTQVRSVVLKHYGSKCSCCGERRKEFLEARRLDDRSSTGHTDHGAQARAIYRWLEAEGFPPGFGLLCHNCFWARQIHGSCPCQGASIPSPGMPKRVTRELTPAVGQRD